MGSWARRGSAGVCAALVLAAVVSTASANRLSTSSQPVRATWSQVSFEFGPGIGTIRCAVTLEGSFHGRTFAKAREALVGYITRALIQTPCSNAELHFLGETLPWHLRYEAFTGTLPRMTSVRFKLAELSLWFTREFGIRCLYRSPLSFTWFRGEPSPIPEFPEFGTPASVSLEGSLPENQGGICLGTIRVEGRGGRLTTEGGSTEVTLSLI
jgi:hypothetical protein